MRVPCAAALVAAALAFACACAREASPPNQPSIALTAPAAPSAASIDIAGFNAASLAALASRSPDAESWRDVVRVDVLPDGAETPPANLPPVAGRYAVADGVVRVRPAFSLDPGTRYLVRVEATSLPGGAPSVVTAIVSRPAVAITMAPATVVAIAPGGDVIPENVLRLYLHFSAPMGRRGAGQVRLLDASGKEVVDPFLPLEAELWSGDRTRYTLFFDPGRVKTGIRPNEEMGRALVRGHRYTLVVDVDWKDAYGRPLAGQYRHAFRASAAIDRPIDPKTWRLTAPKAGTRDALVATFPYALDQGLLARALSVETTPGAAVAGASTTDATQTTWRFVPDQPWRGGAYDLAVLGILEDPSGNRIGRAFEIESTAAGSDVDRAVVPFMIAP